MTDKSMMEILSKFNAVSKPVTECGMPNQGVTLQASSASEMAEILRALAGVEAGANPATQMPPMGDMPSKAMKLPMLAPEGSVEEGGMKDMLTAKAEMMDREDFIADAGDMGMDTQEAAEFWDNVNGEMESYDNEPGEEYMDAADMVPNGTDLHRKKPMGAIRVKDPAVKSESIKERLWAALTEKKEKNSVNEISSDLAKRYTKNAKVDRDNTDHILKRDGSSNDYKTNQQLQKRNSKRTKGINRAAKRMDK